MASSEFNQMSFDIAAMKGDVKTIKAFKTKAPDIFKKGAYTAAWCAARDGHVEVVKFILENEPAAKKRIGNMFEVAVNNNCLDVLKYLEETDPTVIETNGPAAFYEAFFNVQADTMRYLAPKLSDHIVRHILMDGGIDKVRYALEMAQSIKQSAGKSLQDGQDPQMIKEYLDSPVQGYDAYKRGAETILELMIQYIDKKKPGNSPSP